MKTLNSIIISLLLFSQSSFSQDSIFFKNKNVLAVKLAEINQTEIKYFHFKSLDEATYTVSKDDVLFLKYSNGIIDTIKSNTNSGTSLVLSIKPDNESQKINIVGKRLYYDDRVLGDQQLKFLIKNYSNPKDREVLMREYRKMKHYELTQKVYAPLGFIVGFAIPVATSSYVLQNETNDDMGLFFGGIVAGAVVRIVNNFIHHVAGNKRHNTKRQIALLYNQNL